MLFQVQQATEVVWVVELLQLLGQQVRNELVTATPETFMRKQGEAVGYDKLLKLIHRQNPVT